MTAAADELLACLGKASFFGATGPVERIETHCAVVFLVAASAYKLKKAVRFSYLDFTTLAQRKAALEAELALNRRFAPTLYRRVLPVTRETDGALALAGVGPAVEWLLEMRRFDQQDRLDHIAARGRLSDALIDRLALIVGAAHRASPRARAGFGGAKGMARVMASNAEELDALVPSVFAAGPVAGLKDALARHLARARPLIDRRRDQGFSRHCHGDLHLANIALIDGAPVLFDCIEFSEDIATVDILYDLAFLLMDLGHRGLRGGANRLFNAYIDAALEAEGLALLDGLALLPFFLASRATVRAHVVGNQARASAHARREEAEAYLAEAAAYAKPVAPTLIAVGGVSGSGKSSLARRLAPDLGPDPGARIVRSDVVRKRLFGVPFTTTLGEEGYSRAASIETYGQLFAEAEAALRAGASVILDAVFLRPDERAAAEGLARRWGTPFAGFWLDAPDPVLAARLEARRGDVSDATSAVLARQRAQDPGALSWQRLDAGRAPDEIAAEAGQALLTLRADALAARAGLA